MMDVQRTKEGNKVDKMESDDVKHLFDKLSDICKRLEEKGEKVLVFTTADKNQVGEHLENGFISGTADMLTKFQQLCEGADTGLPLTDKRKDSEKTDQSNVIPAETEFEKHEEDLTILEHCKSNDDMANDDGDDEMMAEMSTDEKIHQTVDNKKFRKMDLNETVGGTEGLNEKVEQPQISFVDTSKNFETRSDLNIGAVSELMPCQRSLRLEKKGKVKSEHRVLDIQQSYLFNNGRKTRLREHVKKEHLNNTVEIDVKATSAALHGNDNDKIESICEETVEKKQESHCNNVDLIDKDPTVSGSSLAQVKCEKCDLEFIHEEHLKTHQRRIPNCVSVVKEFESENNSKIDSLIINSTDTQGNQVKVKVKDLLCSQNKEPYQCPICSSLFSKKSNFKRHIVRHSDSQITCYICGMKFNGRGNYSKHMKHHTERPFQCEKCDKKRFLSEAKLLDHMASCNKYTRDDLMCDTCGYVAKCRAALKIHQNVHLGVKPHTCDHCGKKMSTMASLERHIMSMHQDDTPYECETCHKTFKTKDNYKKHQKYHEEPKYKCEICGKTCIEYGNLKKHMVSHTKEKPFICEICGNSFSRNSLLENHRRLHTGEKPYKCTEKGCDKSFRSYANLKQHLRNHSADKPFVCDVCGKAFKQPGRMNHHKKSHLVAYRWVCAYCPEMFKTLFVYKGHLAREHPHMKKDIEMKTNIKLHQCHLCEKVYGEKDDLVRHIYIHKGLKPFKCEYCSKAFNDKSNLKQHTRIHLNDRKYCCQLCNKAFVLRRVLRAHMSNAHGFVQPKTATFERRVVYKQKQLKSSVNKRNPSDPGQEDSPLPWTKETHVVLEKEGGVNEGTETSHVLEMGQPRPLLDKEFQLDTDNSKDNAVKNLHKVELCWDCKSQENLVVPNLQLTQLSRTPMMTVEFVQPVIVLKNAYS